MERTKDLQNNINKKTFQYITNEWLSMAFLAVYKLTNQSTWLSVSIHDLTNQVN